jgi:hypothetical protein
MTEGLWGLGGVVLGAALTTPLTLFKDWWMVSQNRKRQAYYLAIRVVCVLDQYIESCAHVACEDDEHIGRDDSGAPVSDFEDPKKPTYPDDIDWRSIKPNLMYRILSFPNEIDAASRAIFKEWEFGDVWDAFYERQSQYAGLGLTAASITDKLRQEYSIQTRTLSDWSPIETLKSVKQEHETRKMKAAAQPLCGGGSQ